MSGNLQFKKILLSWAILAVSSLIFSPENNLKAILFSNTRLLVFKGSTLETFLGSISFIFTLKLWTEVNEDITVEGQGHSVPSWLLTSALDSEHLLSPAPEILLKVKSL